MKFKIKDIEINVEFVAIIVVLLNIIPQCRRYLENYYICFLFIIFHELSHVFVSSLFGIKTQKIYVRICGLNISLNKKDEKNIMWLLIYLAGPLSNLVLALLFNKIKFVFSINICLMVINLLPIKPLDGYNIIDIFLRLIRIKKRKSILLITKYFITISLSIIGLIQLVIFKNPSMILIIMYIFIQNKRIEKTNKKLYIKNITKILQNF